MINPAKYKIIADIINSAQAKGTNMIDNISIMSDHLVSSEVENENIDKLWFFNIIQRNYNIFNTNHAVKSRKILNFVKALQIYITNEYGNVNNYLSNNSTKVLPIFAEISEEVGFPIDAFNIDFGDASVIDLGDIS